MQVFDRSGLLLICCVSLADVWILHYYQTATVVTVVSVAVIVLVNYISKRRTETEFRFTCSGFFIYSEICVFVCTGLHSGVCVWSKRLFHQLQSEALHTHEHKPASKGKSAASEPKLSFGMEFRYG